MCPQKRVLFANNGPLYRNNGMYYTRTLGNKLIRRYHILGNQVSFLVRVKEICDDIVNKHEMINETGFSVIDVPDMMNIKNRLLNYKDIRHIVFNAVKSHDIIILRNPSYVGNLALKYSKKLNKPYIVEFVACPWDAMWYYNWKGKILAPYAYFKNRWAIYDSSCVIYVTNKFLQQRYPTKGMTFSISNVEIDEVSEDVLNKRIKKIEQLDLKGPIFIGTAANIDVPYKGQADVIKALYLLRQLGETRFRYKIIGAGNPERLQNIIKKLDMQHYVSLEGPMKHSDILSFYDDLDIYIQPSKQEGLPRSVIEAMSRACPVIGARTGGIPELINHQYVFHKGKVEQLKFILSNIVEKQLLESESIKNFNEAKKYTRELIEYKRNEVYCRFVDSSGQFK